MENKLSEIGNNNLTMNYKKTEDILADMQGIIETTQKAMFYLQQQEKEIEQFNPLTTKKRQGDFCVIYLEINNSFLAVLKRLQFAVGML